MDELDRKLQEALLKVQEAFRSGDYEEAEAFYMQHPDLSRHPRFNIVERFIAKRKEAMLRDSVLESSLKSQDRIYDFSKRSEEAMGHITGGSRIPDEDGCRLVDGACATNDTIESYKRELETMRDFIDFLIERYEGDPYRFDEDRKGTPWKQDEVDSYESELAITDSVIQDSVVTQNTVNNFTNTVNNIIQEGGIEGERMEDFARKLAEINHRLGSFSVNSMEQEKELASKLKGISESEVKPMFANYDPEFLERLQNKEAHMEEVLLKQSEMEKMLTNLLAQHREVLGEDAPGELEKLEMLTSRYHVKYDLEEIKRTNTVVFIDDFTWREAKLKPLYFKVFYNGPNEMVRIVERKGGRQTCVDYLRDNRIIRKELYSEGDDVLTRLKTYVYYPSGKLNVMSDYEATPGIETYYTYDEKGKLLKKEEEKAE